MHFLIKSFKINFVFFLLIALLSYNADAESIDENKLIDLETRIIDLQNRVSKLESILSDKSNKENDLEFTDKVISNNVPIVEEEAEKDLRSNISNENLFSDNSKSDIEELYNQAIQEIRMQRYDNASKILTEIINIKQIDENDSSIKEILSNSNYLLGEIEFKQKKYESASKYFLEAYNRFIQISKSNIQAANSLFQLSKSLEMMGKKEGACNSIKKIKKDFNELPESLKEKVDIENIKLNCG